MADPATRAIERLYRVPPGDFTRERNAQVAALRKAGHTAEAQAVGRLRRPSPVLWAINQLAHTEPARLQAFLDAVSRVRATQLRDPRAAGEAIARQRAELEALVSRVGELLGAQGHRATVATQRRVSNTLLGAAVEPSRLADLRHGRLTEELAAPGFEVLTGAPGAGRLRVVQGGKAARPADAGPRDGARRGEQDRRAREERRAGEAQRAADAARARRRDEEVEEQEAERERARRAEEALAREAVARQEAVRRLEQEVQDLAENLAAARGRLQEARRAAKAAGRRAGRRRPR